MDLRSHVDLYMNNQYYILRKSILTKMRKPLGRSGGSRMIIIPDFWLRSLERTHGKLPEEMELELNDETIIVRPVYENGGGEED